ncbi:MAG: 50S ribosomal protein L11 methyltransferase [Thermodesulfobacteriota bacterium]
MLRPPHRAYRRLYTYHFNRRVMPDLSHDPDCIGLWQEHDTAIYFFHDARDEEMEKLATATGATLFYRADLDYRDWEAGQEIAPFTVGHLRIAPVWDANGGDIVLDPGVVFGSGFHPTTRLCLEGMLELLALRPARRLIDLGTGSGLLAVAGAKLGVASVFACDFNPLACRVAQANCHRNNVAVDIACLDLFASFPGRQSDILVANLHLELLLHLFTQPAFRQQDFLILAGFRAAQEEKLLAALPTADLRLIDRRQQDGWCRWILRRRDSVTGN